jgi:hypothetical protein
MVTDRERLAGRRWMPDRSQDGNHGLSELLHYARRDRHFGSFIEGITRQARSKLDGISAAAQQRINSSSAMIQRWLNRELS